MAVALIFYATAFALILMPALVTGARAARGVWAFYSLTILLYGALNIASLRRQEDFQVRLFLFTGMTVSLTLLYHAVPIHYDGTFRDDVMIALESIVYMTNFAVVTHMASLIPRRNAFVERHRWIVPSAYALGVLLAITDFAILMSAIHRPDSQDALAGALTARIVMNVASYILAGVVALTLLGHAARHDPSVAARRQAVIVFAGLVLWTLNLGALLFVPPYRSHPVADFIEAAAIIAVPIAFFISIVGYRLFELGLIVRRALILVSTAGLLALFVLLGGAAAGHFFEKVYGIKATIWMSGALFFVAGVLFRSLERLISRIIDRRFFREKVELQQLTRLVIPELGSFTVPDEAALHLVSRLRTTVGVDTAILLTSDEAGEFYRIRAQSGILPGEAMNVVVTAAELEPFAIEIAHARPFTRDRKREGAHLARMLDLLGACVVVPAKLKDRLVGLIILGQTLHEWELDPDDLTALEIIAQQASAMMENARLFDLAMNDHLTGLPRMQVAMDRLTTDVARCRRSFHPFAVAMADIDAFKTINDTRGHHAGDIVLKSAAQLFTAHSRRIDSVARYGGDEFFFHFLETGAEGAVVHAERLRRRVEELPIVVEGEAVKATVSIGLCVVDAPEALDDPAELVRRADEALYAAKRKGRNRVEVWESASQRPA